MDDFSYIINSSDRECTITIGTECMTVGSNEMLILEFSEVRQRLSRPREKCTVSLTDEELTLCLNALDMYSRLFIGQYDVIESLFRYDSDYMNEFNDNHYVRLSLLRAIRSKLFAGTDIARYDFSSSLGIWSPFTNIRAKNAYDILQILRYNTTGSGIYF